MASLLLSRSRPLFSLTLGLGLSSLYATQALYRHKPLLCEASGATPLTTVSESFKTYSQDAKVPVFKDGRPNPQAYRQISAGSILGTLDSCAWDLWESRGGHGTGNANQEERILKTCKANALVVLGVLGGVAVSTFSKTLAMLFGLLVFGVQVCRSAYG